MKKFSVLFLILSIPISVFIINEAVNSASAETAPLSVDMFKNIPLTGFWEEITMELIISKEGWIVNKINKFDKKKEVHDKGNYASFNNYLGNGKDYFVLKLYYEKKDILDDIPVVTLMVDFKKKSLWSKKNNFKVSIE